MAVWLQREGRYQIEAGSEVNVVQTWRDGAVTRRWTDDRPSTGETAVQECSADASIACLADDAGGVAYLITDPVRNLPFSTYDLGALPMQGLAVVAKVPVVDPSGQMVSLPPLPPRGMKIRNIVVAPAGEVWAAEVRTSRGTKVFRPSTRRVRKVGDARDVDLVRLRY